jgi:hypothetical protein
MNKNSEILLVPATGRSIKLTDFYYQYRDLLSAPESKIIDGALDHFPDPSLTSFTATPLMRADSPFAKIHTTKHLTANKSGKRSAHLTTEQIKIKGCRPLLTEFPQWEIDRDYHLQINYIPGGTMSAVAILKELLGFALQTINNIPCPAIPISIYQYDTGREAEFALLFLAATDLRIESLIQTKHSLHQVILNNTLAIDTSHAKETSLKLSEFDRYITHKSALLCDLHFLGLFRGILNSNIGNELVQGDRFIGFCDFDSAYLMSPPPKTDRAQIVDFTIRSFLELLKASLPIETFIFQQDSNRQALTPRLVEVYQATSSIYSSYLNRFLQKAVDLNWNLTTVYDGIKQTFQTQIAAQLLQELIPNSVTIRDLKSVSNYEPHNFS